MENNTILIVDDEADVLTLLGMELSNEGYTVLKASSGVEAIRKAKLFVPNLIVLDILMPDMNGGQVLQALKADFKTKNIPIIFLTAVLSKEEERAKQLGVAIDQVFYPAIAKPFDVLELLSEVYKLMHKTGKGV